MSNDTWEIAQLWARSSALRFIVAAAADTGMVGEGALSDDETFFSEGLPALFAVSRLSGANAAISASVAVPGPDFGWPFDRRSNLGPALRADRRATDETGCSGISDAGSNATVRS